MSRDATDLLSFVRRGLQAKQADPGWLTIAAETDLNYSTIWRVFHEKRDVKLSTLESIAAWLRSNKSKRARA